MELGFFDLILLGILGVGFITVLGLQMVFVLTARDITKPFAAGRHTIRLTEGKLVRHKTLVLYRPAAWARIV